MKLKTLKAHLDSPETLSMAFTFHNFFTDNASRFCEANGTWNGYSNYTMCKVLHSGETDASQAFMVQTYSFFIYLCGYSISLIALFIALTTFCYFK